MTLTKAELSERLYEKTNFNKVDAKAFVEHFFERIKVALEQGESVKLSGFGNFEVRRKKERPGRNPKTGMEVLITARKVVTFKAGQKLKAHILACLSGRSAAW